MRLALRGIVALRRTKVANRPARPLGCPGGPVRPGATARAPAIRGRRPEQSDLSETADLEANHVVDLGRLADGERADRIRASDELVDELVKEPVRLAAHLSGRIGPRSRGETLAGHPQRPLGDRRVDWRALTRTPRRLLSAWLNLESCRLKRSHATQ